MLSQRKLVMKNRFSEDGWSWYDQMLGLFGDPALKTVVKVDWSCYSKDRR